VCVRVYVCVCVCVYVCAGSTQYRNLNVVHENIA